MATMTRGITIAANERITPARYHALIESATLNNVTNSELVSGVRFINSVTPVSPATGDTRVGTSGLIEVYYSGAWNAVTTDPLDITLTLNVASAAVAAYQLVFPDPSNTGKFLGLGAPGTNRENPFGVVQTTTAPGGSATVRLRGQTSILIYGAYSVGDFIKKYVGDFDSATVGDGSTTDHFGFMLSSGGTPGAQTTGTAYIWK